VLEFRVTARVRVKVRVIVRGSWGYETHGYERVRYEMSGSRYELRDCLLLSSVPPFQLIRGLWH